MANNVGPEFAGQTDTGLVRVQNEDAIAIGTARAYAILADGMGGYNAGEVASSIATMVTRDLLEQGLVNVRDAEGKLSIRGRQVHRMLVEAIQKANSAIFDAAHAEPQYEGMGTTIVAAVFQHDKVTIAHVGDSRAYRLRNGELSQVTRDHSLLQEQIDAGLIDPAMARYSHIKNLVTRAVGVASDVEVEIHDHLLQAGDIYLLCSDGLSDMLLDEDIRSILLREQRNLDAACRHLVQRANANGGFDNISVILARVPSTISEPASLLGRILNWLS